MLDDLQWADAESAALLDFLAPDLASSHLVVLATARRDELGVLPRADVVVELAGLDADELRELLAELIDDEVDDDLLATVARHTGGNPLFVGEAARLLRRPVTPPTRRKARCRPGGVRAVLSRRLARLPQPTHDALAGAAVLGPTSTPPPSPGCSSPIAPTPTTASTRPSPPVCSATRAAGAGASRMLSCERPSRTPSPRPGAGCCTCGRPRARGPRWRPCRGCDRRAPHGRRRRPRRGGLGGMRRRRGVPRWMYADAVVWYRRAAATVPWPDLRCRLADALSRVGRLAEADAEYMAAAREAEPLATSPWWPAALGIGTIGGGFEVRLLDATSSRCSTRRCPCSTRPTPLPVPC